MMKAAASLLILGIAVLLVSAGILFLTRDRLADLPANPVNQLVQAEKKNLEEIAAMSQTGIISGAAMAGVSGVAAAWLVRRGW